MEAIKNQFPHSQKEGGTILNLLVAPETILDKYNVPWTVRPRSNYKPCSIEFSATFFKKKVFAASGDTILDLDKNDKTLAPKAKGLKLLPAQQQLKFISMELVACVKMSLMCTRLLCGGKLHNHRLLLIVRTDLP